MPTSEEWLLVDEIMGLFNTINRYNNSSFVQQMLSAHNGLPVDVSRCNLDCPLRIDYPCIQIVGTVQTGIVHELYDMGFKKITAEAVKAGADFGFARRTVMYMLKDFCQRNFIIKDKQGNYEKVQK